MDEQIQRTLDQFSCVWPRVRPQGPPPPPPPPPKPMPPSPPPKPGHEREGKRLCRLVADESRRRDCLRRLARQTRGSMSRQLAALAQQSGERLRQMQTEAFLLRGDSCPLPPAPPPGRPLEELRRLYLAEEKAGRAYAQAASETDNATLRRIYTQYAKEADRRVQALRRVLEAAM